MITNEISKGAALLQAAAPAVEQTGDTPLGEKFSSVLQAMLGGSLEAVLGEVAGMGMVQVAAAAAPVKEEVKVKEEEEITDDAVDLLDDGNVQQSKDDEKDTEGEQGGAEVGVVQAPVQLTAEVVQDEAVDVAAPEVVQLMTAAGEKLNPEAKGTAPEFLLQKTDVPVGNPQQEMSKDARGQNPAVQTLTTVSGMQAVKENAGKPASQAGQAAEGESYYAIQRVLERMTDGIQPDAAPQGTQSPMPQASKPGAPAETPKVNAETALAQGMLARLAGSAEQVAAQTNVKGSEGGNGVAAVGLGNQAAAEKFTITKAKPQQTMPAKNQDKVVEEVKKLLEKAVQNRDGNSISVELNPKDLGKMTVKVTQRESQVYARIIPESPEVEQVLRQRVGEVTQVLVAAGLKPDQVLVSIGRERTDAEAFQFQQFMSHSDRNGSRGDKGGSNEGQSEEGMWTGNMPSDAEEAVVDAGWVA